MPELPAPPPQTIGKQYNQSMYWHENRSNLRNRLLLAKEHSKVVAKITLYLVLREIHYSTQFSYPDSEILVIEVKGIFMEIVP